MRRPASSVLIAVGVAALLAGCTAGPSSRPAIVGGAGAAQPPAPPAQPGPRAVPPLEPSHSIQLSWHGCELTSLDNASPALPSLPAADQPQCATMSPQLGADGLPSTMTTQVNLIKIGTGDVPLVVLNDVDGEPGTAFTTRLAAGLPPSVLAKFSLIGMDRRGTGSSDGVNCVPQQDRNQILGYDPGSDNLDGLLAAERDAAQECQTDLESRLQTMTTQHTVGDIEQLRDMLGVQHLNAIGRGEGARVFGQYAKAFPDHVGRMVFDGFPDPNAEIQDRTDTEATASEDTFDAFATACTAAGNCALGSDPRHTVTGLLAALRTTPLSTSDGVRVTNGLATHALLRGLADPGRWPELTTALVKAGHGDGAGLAAFVRPQLVGDDDLGSELDAQMVTGCSDESARLPPQQVTALVSQWRAKHPLFGAALAQGLLLCLPWPVSANPVGKPGGDRLPPILVLSTANDPVTPDEGTKRAAQQLDTAKLVSWEGSGHGALGRSECATTAATQFLLNATLPSTSIVCPA